MAEVILLCGKVAAGKSTYANRLAQQKRAVILSVDDLVVRMRTKCEGPAALQQLEAQIRDYFLTLLQPLLQADVTVIIDHGHYRSRTLGPLLPKTGYFLLPGKSSAASPDLCGV